MTFAVEDTRTADRRPASVVLDAAGLPLHTLTVRKGGAYAGKRDFRPAKARHLVPGAALWLKVGKFWAEVVYRPAEPTAPSQLHEARQDVPAVVPALELAEVPETAQPANQEHERAIDTRIVAAEQVERAEPTPARQNAPKVQRTASYHTINGRLGTLELTIPSGRKVETFGYYAEPLPTDFGGRFRCFRLTKYRTQQHPDEPAAYDVLLDLEPDDPDRPGHSCECLGWLRWGKCKHVASLAALHRQGKLDAPAAEEVAHA